MQAHFLRRLFNIKYPIIQAPMAGGMTTPYLVATVCEANALGFLASGMLASTQLKTQIIEVKKLTNKPFGVNLFITEPIVNLNKTKQVALQEIENQIGLKNSSKTVNVNIDEELEAKIDLILEYNVPIISFTFGLPSQKIIDQLKANNVFLMATACNITEALFVQNSKIDAVILQGSEAGGHRGSFLISNQQSDQLGLLALLQEAKKCLSIPYIAAGGISTGSSMLACMVLGAQAVQIGTAFLLTQESATIKSHKHALKSTKAEDTVITNVITGKNVRSIANKLITQLEASSEPIESYPVQAALTKDLRNFAIKNNLSDYQAFWCGQGIGCVREQSVDELIHRIIDEYNEQLYETKKSFHPF